MNSSQIVKKEANENYQLWKLDQLQKVTFLYIITSLIALSIGIFFGPLQAFNYGGYDAYGVLYPVVKNYYQGLTLHGVLNAFGFTTFFISGLLLYLSTRELNEFPNPIVSWVIYAVMLLGLLLTAFSIISNQATVLYTFYAPMLANAAFYIGIGLIIIASWLVGWQIIKLRSKWLSNNIGQVTPLVTWMSVVIMIMWFLASLGAVSSALIWQIPAALGWIDGVPPMITRTLFWWTGHPIVYFWLLPAYVSWYALLPRQVGGVLVSEPLARLSFILFMIFSLPVGIHHQFMDAGIPNLMMGIVVFLTFLVILPSLLTAFTVGASLEQAGRKHGGQGLLGWLFKLPWKNPSVAAQLMAMVLFIIGGASGMVNGSWAINAIIHNTIWVPGHFHVTLASATTLTFFGIGFWLVPNLVKKPLVSPKTALIGCWLWFIGMLIFSNAMMVGGLLGVPRRAWVSGMTAGEGFANFYSNAIWPLTLTAIAGIILAIATVLIFGVLFATVIRPRDSINIEASIQIPFAQTLHAVHTQKWMHLSDRIGLWTFVSAILLILVYGPILWAMRDMNVPLPGIRVW